MLFCGPGELGENCSILAGHEFCRTLSYISFSIWECKEGLQAEVEFEPHQGFSTNGNGILINSISVNGYSLGNRKLIILSSTNDG